VDFVDEILIPIKSIVRYSTHPSMNKRMPNDGFEVTRVERSKEAARAAYGQAEQMV
jgi:hypothetical protein